MFYRQIGTKIRYHREKQFMTQDDLGKKTGFSQSYIAKIETGKATPSLKRLEIFAKALGVDIKDFWEGGGE
ncbi:MAG: helix-turn-helix transcriptional regulator [Candidatus Omnitrophota bacterium]|jgi:transcriptional regulator with XRE-family HTH domain